MDRHKILIIDDDQDFLKIMQKILGGKGYDCELVQDAKSAEQKLEKMEFKLILCDLYMPYMNGIEFVKAIRSHSSDKIKFLPIIIISGMLSNEVLNDLQNLGIEHIYKKPVNYFSLIQTMEELIS